jgi:hypothetical protein
LVRETHYKAYTRGHKKLSGRKNTAGGNPKETGSIGGATYF